MSDLPPRSRRANRISGIARHGRLKRHSAVLALVKGAAIVLAVVLVSGGSVAAIALWNLDRVIQGNSVDISARNDEELPAIGEFDGGVNLLLVGSDSGEGDPRYGYRDAALNDVTMLMHISEDHTNAVVVSFPRDLIVSIPACPRPDGGNYSAMGAQPINVTLSYGGLPCTVKTVEELTGLEIPFAAEIQFNGVIEMSNAIGGVPVCVAEPIRDSYTGLTLAAGEHTLKGMDALQFLRTRHGVGDGSDLGRISNQQVFLSSLVRTVKSAQTLSDPTKLYGLAKAAVDNMKLSTSLASYDTLVSIALTLRDVPLENVAFVQYPGTTSGTGVYAGKVQPIESAAEEMFDLIKADKKFVLSPDAENIGSVADPNATPTETPAPGGDLTPEETTTPDAAATPSATATPGPPDVPVLPPSVTGQTAADRTCSDGRRD